MDSASEGSASQRPRSARVALGRALGIAALALALASVGILLEAPDGTGIRPLHLGPALFLTAPMGLIGAVFSSYGIHDPPPIRRRALAGMALGLLPAPVVIFGTQWIVWLKDLHLLP